MKTERVIDKDKENNLFTNEQVVVVCASDNNYAMPLAVTIRSATENLAKNRNIIFFIIDGGITERNKRRILKSCSSDRCEIQWIPKPDDLINETVIPASIYSESPLVAHITISTWYRLVIDKLLPQEFKKAIYMDCDIVVTGDLGKLWDIDVADNYVLAVAGGELSHHRTIKSVLKNWEELGCSESDKYFNAGVLVFNLDKWRSDNMSAKSLEYIQKKQEYIRLGDQDVLNALVIGHWSELDPRWNSVHPVHMTQADIDDAYIIHYAEPTKPWVDLSKHPAIATFYTYLNLTDWSGYQPTVLQRTWRRIKREVKKLINLK